MFLLFFFFKYIYSLHGFTEQPHSIAETKLAVVTSNQGNSFVFHNMKKHGLILMALLQFSCKISEMPSIDECCLRSDLGQQPFFAARCYALWLSLQDRNLDVKIANAVLVCVGYFQCASGRFKVTVLLASVTLKK